MSSLAEAADVKVVVGDYASVDPANKLNILGAGFNVTSGAQAAREVQVAPQAVAVLVSLPGRYLNKEFSLSIELRRLSDNRVVAVPFAPGMPAQALRIQQITKVPPIADAYRAVVPDDMWATLPFVLNFAAGISLEPDEGYAWRVEIDGQHRQAWRSRFFVLKPPSEPVVGGPATTYGTGAADIPDPFIDDPRTDNDDLGEPGP